MILRNRYPDKRLRKERYNLLRYCGMLPDMARKVRDFHNNQLINTLRAYQDHFYMVPKNDNS